MLELAVEYRLYSQYCRQSMRSQEVGSRETRTGARQRDCGGSLIQNSRPSSKSSFNRNPVDNIIYILSNNQYVISDLSVLHEKLTRQIRFRKAIQVHFWVILEYIPIHSKH